MKCVYGWAGVRYVITKFSRMDSLPNFLTHGAPLRAREARESSAKKLELVFEFIEFKNYSQPKSIVPPKITLMNLLFES